MFKAIPPALLVGATLHSAIDAFFHLGLPLVLFGMPSHHYPVDVLIRVAPSTPHFLFLIVFRSPHLGNTMLDFLPRRLIIFVFFDLEFDFALVSTSMPVGEVKMLVGRLFCKWRVLAGVQTLTVVCF